ncbi:MAG: hypothetical protein E6L04_06775 [Thaumarchaeota archaeon]|nr:MAG: hypothetical protein E6L04_06775 [Nitrososphaerota archaeon]
MRSTITLLIGLITVLLFLSIYATPYVNGQVSNPNNKTSNENPFLLRGSNNNINTGSSTNPSQTNDGSTDKNNNDGFSNNNHDNKKGSDNNKASEDNKDSKSKDDGKKFELPFP